MPESWEDALRFYSGSQHKVTTRAEVQSPSWFTLEVKSQRGNMNTPLAMTVIRGGHGYDVCLDIGWKQGPTPYLTTVGLKLTGEVAKVWHEFCAQPSLVLDPAGTDLTAAASFGHASDYFQRIDTWLTTWTRNVRTWASDVDGADSQWQGNAAGVFKALLNGFAGQIESVSLQLDPKVLAFATKVGEASVNNGRNELADAWNKWYVPAGSAGRIVAPLDALEASLLQVSTVKPTMGLVNRKWNINFPGWGEVSGEAFVASVNTYARKQWADAVTGALDPRATQVLANVTPILNATATFMHNAPLITPPLRLPPGRGVGPNGIGGANGGPELSGLGGLDGPEGIDGPEGSTSGPGGGGLTGPGGSGLTGPPELGLNDIGAVTGPEGAGIQGPNGETILGPDGLPSTGGGGGVLGPDGLSGPGGGAGVLGPDGEPVLGPNGMPVMVPPGSVIGPDGRVTAPNGTPVLGPGGLPMTVPKGSVRADRIVGPNGEPLTSGGARLTVPKGSLVNGDGTITTPGGSLLRDAGGKPVTVPPGSQVSANGTVVGPDGTPVTAPDDTPLRVPEGSRVNGDGTITDPSGKQVTRTDGTALKVPEGSTVGPDGTVLGPDGDPLPAPQGSSVTVPQGSRIAADGTVIGPDNRPVIGPDGEPLTVPEGSRLQSELPTGLDRRLLGPTGSGNVQVPIGSQVLPDGSVVGPNGNPLLGPDGGPLKGDPGSWVTSDGLLLSGTSPGDPLVVPPGSVIGPDGSVVGPDGEPVADRLGNPLMVPPGARIGPGGAVLDAGGHPLVTPRSSAAADFGEQMVSRRGPAGLVGPDAGMPGTPMRTSTVAHSDDGLGVGSRPLTGQARGYLGSDGRVVTDFDGAAPMVGRRGNPMLAAEEAMLARQQGAAGMPMMPPMGGMGGGGGGGSTGPNRQGAAWLVEDEDVWGTDADAPPGVIGR